MLQFAGSFYRAVSEANLSFPFCSLPPLSLVFAFVSIHDAPFFRPLSTLVLTARVLPISQFTMYNSQLMRLRANHSSRDFALLHCNTTTTATSTGNQNPGSEQKKILVFVGWGGGGSLFFVFRFSNKTQKLEDGRRMPTTIFTLLEVTLEFAI